jgi:coenzyme F420-reducing hydrogenase delta subunit
MSVSLSPDVLVYACTNCIPAGVRLPRQWKQDGAHVVLHEAPCSGKMDCQYLMHAMEGGAAGVCVVACPKGDCRLSQGNYRAEIRIHTIQKLLREVGLESDRAVLLHFSPDDPPEQLLPAIRQTVDQICALGTSSLRAPNETRTGNAAAQIEGKTVLK